jgi:hypothetical protein
MFLPLHPSLEFLSLLFSTPPMLRNHSIRVLTIC